MTTESCSWCHEMNDVRDEYCQTCGHQAHASRMNCLCEQCAPGRHAVEDEGIEPFSDAEYNGL
jgi:nitrate/TMAO reductase-like tetraheme cytochrome c subunit